LDSEKRVIRSQSKEKQQPLLFRQLHETKY
jgi:hypothetical protein